METEQTYQPSFFAPEDETDRLLELFPEVWGAMEALTTGEVDDKRKALLLLRSRGALRASPLVAYVVTTRIIDEDLEIRSLVVQATADSLRPDGKGNTTPEQVRTSIRNKLHEMGGRELLKLTEVAAGNPECEGDVVLLLSSCIQAGRHLVDIASSRSVPLPIREQAVRLVGLVGYTDALTPLQRMCSRLEARVEGQQSMPFAPPASGDEQILLPVVRRALSMLNAP